MYIKLKARSHDKSTHLALESNVWLLSQTIMPPYINIALINNRNRHYHSVNRSQSFNILFETDIVKWKNLIHLIMEKYSF